MKNFINFVLLYLVVGVFCIIISAIYSRPIFIVIGICFIGLGIANALKLRRLRGKK